MKCEDNAVCSIPLSCEKTYKAQTGRCLNEHLKARKYTLTITGEPPLKARVNYCGACRPIFESTVAARRNSERLNREVIEAFLVKRSGDDNVSKKLLRLTDEDDGFLEAELEEDVGERAAV